MYMDMDDSSRFSNRGKFSISVGENTRNFFLVFGGIPTEAIMYARKFKPYGVRFDGPAGAIAAAQFEQCERDRSGGDQATKLDLKQASALDIMGGDAELLAEVVEAFLNL